MDITEGAVWVLDGEEGKLSKLVPDPVTHPGFEKAIGWYREGVAMAEIARRLNDAGIRPKYGKLLEGRRARFTSCSAPWRSQDALDRQRDSALRQARGVPMAHELRSEGQTLTAIAERLNAAGLRPLKAAAYRWYSVQELLRSAVYHNRSTPRGAGAVSEGARPQPARNRASAGSSGGTSEAGGSGTRRRSS